MLTMLSQTGGQPLMKIGEREIGGNCRPYIIAELCNNFNNDIKTAKRLVLACASAGVNACKFQMHLQNDRLTSQEHILMQQFCIRYDVEYLCTAFDSEGLEILADMGVAAIKIGSKECINSNFLKEAGAIGVPLIISTGGCTQEQVDEIARYADILMHTTSIYPTPYNKVNLRHITNYQLRYYKEPQCIIGLSDHTTTLYTSIAAMGLGAKVIEKHVTLDENQVGPDHKNSIYPDEIKIIVRASFALNDALGFSYPGNRICYNDEAVKLDRP